MLTTKQTAAMLRAALPLLRFDERLEDANLALCVDDDADVLAGRDGEVLGARIELGAARYAPEAVPMADAWLRGTVADWLDVLFDRGRPRLQAGGAPDLAADSLDNLHGAFALGEHAELALA